MIHPTPVTIVSLDGVELEAEVALVTPWQAAAVIVHPHPLFGGSMHVPVMDALFRHLPASGTSTLRFNFRGAGRSGGTHDGGRNERFDLMAAVERLSEAVPAVPLVVVAYSFGADVALEVDVDRVDGWCLIAPPLQTPAIIGTDPRPKLLIVPEHDQFRPPPKAQRATAEWAQTTLLVVPGADHSLAGRMGVAIDAVQTWIGGFAAV